MPGTEETPEPGTAPGTAKKRTGGARRRTGRSPADGQETQTGGKSSASGKPPADGTTPAGASGTTGGQDATGGQRAAGKRSVGRPRRLDPDAMVATARRIIEEEGVAALSMRRVAKELGSTPMALYHYVRDKDELLMLTLSGASDTFPRPELPEDPRERLLAVAVHMHDVLARVPWVLDVLALGELTDKNALWMVEEIIDCAVECGLSPARSVRAYRTIWCYVYADLVFRRAAERRAERRVESPPSMRYFPEMISEDDAATLPRLTALKDRWREYAADYRVAEELDAIIEGLLRHEPRTG
ncbi:TetR/AcrR family transcriptional regulator [Streptomyces sp. NPDC006971]|uniref:TetR/AcrR family transcriptional regulator n=1 Tax=Streptomyces sp. NPDC006971 TaxID=3154784 RepID=UPI0033CBF474